MFEVVSEFILTPLARGFLFCIEIEGARWFQQVEHSNQNLSFVTKLRKRMKIQESILIVQMRSTPPMQLMGQKNRCFCLKSKKYLQVSRNIVRAHEILSSHSVYANCEMKHKNVRYIYYVLEAE